VPIIEKALDLAVTISTRLRFMAAPALERAIRCNVMQHRRATRFSRPKRKSARRRSMRMIETSLKLCRPITSTYGNCTTSHDDGYQRNFRQGWRMEHCSKLATRRLCAISASPDTTADALIEAIHRHPFDTILMAVNARSASTSFSEQLLPLAVEKQMGILE